MWNREVRSRKRKSFWFPLLGLSFAIAGADKLLGVRGYEELFDRWGWRRAGLRLVGAAEFLGGVMVASRSLRRRGGLVLSATSAAVLSKEMQRQETGLAMPRLGLMLAAIAASLL